MYKRQEVLTPVVDPDLQVRLDEVLDVALKDDVLAWTLDAEGRWTRVPPGGEVESHMVLQRLTMARASRAAASTSIV